MAIGVAPTSTRGCTICKLSKREGKSSGTTNEFKLQVKEYIVEVLDDNKKL